MNNKIQSDNQQPAPLPSEGSDSQVTGQQDTTLLGDQRTHSFNDAVGFVSEGKTISQQYAGARELDALLEVVSSDEQNHEIKTFLSRPVRAGNSRWKMSDNHTELNYMNVMSKLNSDEFAVHRTKLAGFYGFRATANYKVVVNAQPFQQGILLVWFCPMGDQFFDMGKAHYGEKNLSYLTGFPCAILNIATQSEVTLSVPYVGVTPFINLAELGKRTSLRHFGTFHTTTLVPLTGGVNTTECEVSYYLSFTDVQLFGATSNIYYPQGPIGAVVNMAGGVLGSLLDQKNTRKKELSPIAGFAGSLLDDALSALSKPNTEPNIQSRLIQPFGNMMVSDSADPTVKLALMKDQNVKVESIGLEEEDEMDIIHLISKPTYLETFDWKKADDTGATIYTTPVEPQSHVGTPDAKNFTFQMASPRLRYVANMFRYWRGGIKYTFHVAATKFHSGRLRFTYNLGRGGKYPFPYNYTWVMDIRDGMTFSVVCPYIAPTVWRRVPHSIGTITAFGLQGIAYVDLDKDSNQAIQLEQDSNWLTIAVENELRGPDTVSGSVSIAIFTSAMPDFQFAAPMIGPNIPSDATGRDLNKLVGNKKYTPQALNDDEIIIDITTGKPPSEQQHPIVNEVCNGEVVTNLRSLIRRYFLIDKSTLTPPNRVIFPFLFPYTSGNHRIVDFINYIMPLFGFFRGGMRYLLLSSKPEEPIYVGYNPHDLSVQFTPFEHVKAKPTDSAILYELAMYKGDTEVPLKEPFELFQNSIQSGVQIFPSTLTGGALIEAPYYNNVDKSLPLLGNNITSEVYKRLVYDYLSPPGTINVYTNSSDLTIFRATADDFTFGYPIGAPDVFNTQFPGVVSFDTITKRQETDV